MSIPQRCAGVLRRKAAKLASPVDAGVLNRCAEVIERQERELAALRAVYAKASDHHEASIDRQLAKALGGMRKIRAELNIAVIGANAVLLDETDCRDLPN